MTFNPVELQRLHNEYGGDVSKIAAALGFESETTVAAAPKTRTRRLQRPEDLGRESMRRFIVSARHSSFSTWPAQDEAKIQAARDKYEAGTHEMAQGRDRDWFVQYCIPRKVRTGARKFFIAGDFS